MRLKMRLDCTGEPPGEFTTTATVGSFDRLNAFSIGPATEASPSPGRSGVAMPMGPVKRRTGTVGVRRNKPMGVLDAATGGKRLPARGKWGAAQLSQG